MRVQCGGISCQLKLCRFFIEIIFRNTIDYNAYFLLQGIVFGYRVIDDDCNVAYDVMKIKKGDS